MIKNIKHFICECIIERILDIFWRILKYILFPICFILMCFKRLKYVFTQDIPVFLQYNVRSPLLYFRNKFEINNDNNFRQLLKLCATHQQDYLLKIIPSDFCDKPELTRDLLFEIVKDFIEQEQCFQYTDYDWNDESKQFKRELIKIYNYIKTPRKKLEKAIHILLKVNPSIVKDSHKEMNISNDEFGYYEEIIIDDYISRLDTEIMKRICTIRSRLWC